MKAKSTEEKPWSSRLKKWSKELISIVILMTLVSMALDWYRSTSMPSGEAPSLKAMTTQGLSVDIIQQSQEKPVVLYFWATWCGACKFVSPTINWFASDHQVLSIALSSGTNERVQQYMTAKEYDFPVINDTTGLISRQWNISVTPTVVIINKGQIESISTGIITPIGLWLRILFA